MTRMLRIALLTLGDPGTLTGGYLYHRRLAELAPAHDARMAYRRARRLLVASEALAEELARGGVPPALLRVVPPGRDVAAAAGPPPGDLRRGRDAAFLCVANWVARKGLHDLLDAFARLP